MSLVSILVVSWLTGSRSTVIIAFNAEDHGRRIAKMPTSPRSYLVQAKNLGFVPYMDVGQMFRTGNNGSAFSYKFAQISSTSLAFLSTCVVMRA